MLQPSMHFNISSWLEVSKVFLTSACSSSTNASLVSRWATIVSKKITRYWLVLNSYWELYCWGSIILLSPCSSHLFKKVS